MGFRTLMWQEAIKVGTIASIFGALRMNGSTDQKPNDNYMHMLWQALDMCLTCDPGFYCELLGITPL